MTQHSQIFADLGLQENESAVYATLLELGEAPVQAIVKRTRLKRPTAYLALSQLEAKGLVEDVKGSSIKRFRVTSPENLQKLVIIRETEIDRAKRVLDHSLPDLVSQYMLALNRPYVVHHAGVHGLKLLHEDVEKTAKDILLIRSPFDSEVPDIEKLILRHIENRAKKGIRTRTITPHLPETLDIARHDAQRLIERRVIPKEKLPTKAQILIYGDKVALTSYRDPLLTTIIENTDIRDTFTTLFEYIWIAATPEHETLIKNAAGE